MYNEREELRILIADGGAVPNSEAGGFPARAAGYASPLNGEWKMKNTPGPWRVRTLERNGEIHDCFVAVNDVNWFAYDAEILDDDEYRDGIERKRIERKLADAPLIAAAPELLAALEDIARGALQEPMSFEQYATQVARAAIAKAHNA